VSGAAASGGAPQGAGRGVVRDLGYRRYDGPRTSDRTRIAVMVLRGLRQAWKRRAVRRLAALPLLPTIGFAVALGAQARIVGGATDSYLLDVTVKVYGALGPAFLLVLQTGTVIADDRRAGAFPFYFARPLTRAQYLAGKAIPVCALAAVATTVPPLLLVAVRIALAGAPDLWTALLLVPRAIVAGLSAALVLSLPQLALSSLARSRAAAQAGYAALVFVGAILGPAVARMTRSAWPLLLSVPAQLESVGRAIYGLAPAADERALPAWAAALAAGALVAASLALARGQLERVEVVAE
jgi:ABC-2 type transport system permease protein